MSRSWTARPAARRSGGSPQSWGRPPSRASCTPLPPSPGAACCSLGVIFLHFVRDILCNETSFTGCVDLSCAQSEAQCRSSHKEQARTNVVYEVVVLGCTWICPCAVQAASHAREECMTLALTRALQHKYSDSGRLYSAPYV